MLAQSFLGAALLAASSVLAHSGCGGHELIRRNPGGRVYNSYAEYEREQKRGAPEGWLRRQATPTDEASAASSTDPSFECTAYSYAPWAAIKANYPTIWESATIVSTDTEAQALFATINASVTAKFPNISPKGTNAGDFSGVSYNYSGDPDCWWTDHECTTPASDTGLAADISTVPEPNTWGLAFDDGPNCSHNAFYDFLRDKGQKATMFYIGSNCADWPLQCLRGLADEHQIAVHSWSHQYMTSFSNEGVFAELYYTRQLFTELLGVTPKYWRPPYGDVDNRVRFIAEALNLTNVIWSDDTDDWKEGVPADNVTAADVTANYQAVINKAASNYYNSSGPVVLTHELTNFTMSEFISQYSAITAAFKYLVPIASALNDTTPYVETNITFPDFLTYTNQSDSSSSSSSASAGSTASGSSGSSASATSAGDAAATTSGASASASTTSSSGAERVQTGALGMAAGLLGAVAMLL